MIQQKQRKKFTCLRAVTFALPSCWCISSKFFLSVTRLDITQKLPSALGGFFVSWGIFLWAFPNSTKVRRGILAHVLGLQISLLPYHDTPKIFCMNSPSAGLKTLVGRSLCWNTHNLHTFFFENRNGRHKRKWSGPNCPSDLSFPVLWLFLLSSLASNSVNGDISVTFSGRYSTA